MLAEERKRPPLIQTGEHVTAIEPGIVDTAPVVPRKVILPAPVEGRYTPGSGHSIIRGGFTWRNGQVLPGSYWNLDGSLHKYVQGGLLVQTQAEVNVKVPWPEAKTNTDPNPVITSENDRLNAEVENLASGNRMLVAQINELRDQMKGRESLIAELTDRASHWESEAKKLQELVRVMEGGEAKTAESSATSPSSGDEGRFHTGENAIVEGPGEPPKPGLVWEAETGSWIDPEVAPTVPVKTTRRNRGSTPPQNPRVEEVEK